MSVSDFWDFSIAEINDILASYNRRKQEKFKEKVRFIFLQADTFENAIARSFDDKARKMHPWDVYPALFEEERKSHEEYSQQEEFESFKERRRAAMDRYNAQRKEVAK